MILPSGPSYNIADERNIHMKRILTLALVLCLVFCLAACGGQSEQKPAPADTQAQTEAPKTEAPETEAPETEAPKTEAPETDAPETEAPETEAPKTEVPETEALETQPAEGETREHGRVEGDSYYNDYLDLKIARPSGWIFYSDEQLALASNLSAELFSDTDISELIKQSGQLIDMMMVDAAGDNVNLLLQPAQAALASVSDEQIFQLAEATFRAQFESAGMKVENYEVCTVKLFGEDKTALKLTMTGMGRTMEEYQIWLRPGGDYMGILTIGFNTEDADPQTIFDGITHIN